MITRFFSNLLSIKSNEWEGVLYLFLVLMVYSFGASFARSIGMTLLISHLKSDILPIMFICVDLLVMVGATIYAHYTKRVSGLDIFSFFLLCSTFFSIIAQFLFYYASGDAYTFSWVYGVFFVGSSFFYILISIHVGSVVASYFTAVQAKRVTGVINAGMPIGGICGGSALVTLLKGFHADPQNLVLVLGISCLGAFALLHIVRTRLSSVRVTNQTIKAGSSRNPFVDMISSVKYVMHSRLMIFMSLGLMMFVIGNKLLEYQYQAIVYPEVFPDTHERAAFFAVYEIFANLAWLLIQLFLTSRIILKMGVGMSNFLYPALIACISFILFVYFYWVAKHQGAGSVTTMLVLSICTQFLNQEMRWALRTPANNLLFNAIPPNLWGTNKAFLNGVVFPAATLIASGFLMFTTGGVQTVMTQITPYIASKDISYILPFVVFIMSILGMLIAFPQSAAYHEGMFGLLNRDLFDRRIDFWSGLRSNSLAQVVEDKLSSPDTYHVIAALEIIRMFRMNQFVNRVGNLMLKTQLFDIKSHCVETLASLPQSNTNITYLMEALRQENDPKLIPLILKNLGRFPSVNLSELVEKLLNHTTPEVFVEACLYLHRHPSYKAKKEIENRLLSRLEHLDDPNFTLYLQAVGELRQAKYSETILPFLDHVKPTIRLAAFNAYVRMLEGHLEPHKSRLIDALYNTSSKDMKVLALQALRECRPLEDWSPVIHLLNARDRAVVNESKGLLQFHLSASEPELVRTLFLQSASVQQRFEILSLLYPRLDVLQRSALRRMADNSLKSFIKVTGLLRLHQIKPNNYESVHELVTKILLEIAEEHLLNVVTVITYEAEQNEEFFQRVGRGLLSHSKANQGNALEVLSNAGERYLSGRLLKFFEERGSDVKTINRMHLVLFAEPLGLTEMNYETQLFAIENDMLRACLYYDSLQHGKSNLRLDHLTKSVRVLLLDSKRAALRAQVAH